MAKAHIDVVRIRTAKRLAKAAGMFVVEKPGKFLLYRKCQPRHALVGACRTPEDLVNLVAAASRTTPEDDSAALP